MGGSDALYRSLVDDAFELIVTIRSDLTIGFINPAMTALTGHAAEDVIGAPIIDFVHPDDAERALTAVAGWDRWGDPAGATSFRVRHADGTWAVYDVTASTVRDEDGTYFAVYGRPADYQHATEAILSQLLTGGSRRDSLAPVLDCFEWRLNGANVAVAWYDPIDGHQAVSTGISPRFAGAVDDPDGPWSQARSTLEPFNDPDGSSLEPGLRDDARAAGLGGVWVEPVADPETGVAALISVWTRVDGPPPGGHAFGMQVARTYVELILRWGHQVDQLEVAASTDPLTGLANRRCFFEVLGSERRTGALLFCDLDGFKPVNDQLGHDAGDEVLCAIASRLQGAVRAGDLVARVGGDEFVVLATGASSAQAAELAVRISDAVAPPIAVRGQQVHVGISIGIAQSDGPLSEDTLTQADRALLDVKAGRRHR